MAVLCKVGLEGGGLGPAVPRSPGPVLRRSGGLLVLRSPGPLVSWSRASSLVALSDGGNPRKSSGSLKKHFPEPETCKL